MTGPRGLRDPAYIDVEEGARVEVFVRRKVERREGGCEGFGVRLGAGRGAGVVRRRSPGRDPKKEVAGRAGGYARAVQVQAQYI